MHCCVYAGTRRVAASIARKLELSDGNGEGHIRLAVVSFNDGQTKLEFGFDAYGPGESERLAAADRIEASPRPPPSRSLYILCASLRLFDGAGTNKQVHGLIVWCSSLC